MNIGILGAGNMGGAIARGYASSIVATERGETVRIFVYDIDASKAKALAELPVISAAADEADLIAKSDVVILAIKPQMFDEAVPRLAGMISDGAGATEKVFASIAAGVGIGWLSDALGGAKVIRVMPNTPVMVGEGMSALARGESITDAEFGSVAEVFGSVGRVIEVSEDALDAVTGISGSSPAYAYMYMQALIESGVRHGLSERDARLLAAQSTLGAAKMVMENGDVSVERMRVNVCSPGGTTIEAVQALEKGDFMDTVKRAVYACVEKSKRMGK
ncbi:MAG: pyrroline-5-carboxylate reductase [Clostridiales Family XIII bacterium]|jgi:pyrroline-5-carboxylate reductase|nr:pyrroline-5-carboxylate reductase [Clostridiales Family XIII bacterium]